MSRRRRRGSCRRRPRTRAGSRSCLDLGRRPSCCDDPGWTCSGRRSARSGAPWFPPAGTGTRAKRRSSLLLLRFVWLRGAALRAAAACSRWLSAAGDWLHGAEGGAVAASASGWHPWLAPWPVHGPGRARRPGVFPGRALRVRLPGSYRAALGGRRCGRSRPRGPWDSGAGARAGRGGCLRRDRPRGRGVAPGWAGGYGFRPARARGRADGPAC